jgi:hypothetical protein
MWEKDSEEHIECDATRWTRTHVLVDLGREAVLDYRGVATRAGREATLTARCRLLS